VETAKKLSPCRLEGFVAARGLSGLGNRSEGMSF
jgi:hypothetical protein